MNITNYNYGKLVPESGNKYEMSHWFLANVRYMLSPCLSSVCRLSVTLVRPTQAV